MPSPAPLDTVDSPAPRTIAPFWLLRAVVAATALGAAIFHLAGGEAALPLWLWKVTQRLEMPADMAVRLLASIEMTLGLVVLLLGRLAPVVSLMALAGLAFASIAELSARFGAGSSITMLAGPMVALAISGALLASRERWWPRPLADADRARSSPGVGHLLAVVGLLLLSLGTAARLPVADRPRPASAGGGEGFVFADPSSWIGRTIPSSGLAARLPLLTAETLEGRHIVVFHSTRCGMCHELFRTFFSDGAHPEVIAVEVPPPAGVVLLESDQPEQVDCPGCRRLVLPAGPKYMPHTPLVMIVNDGRIACVEWRDPAKCILE